MKLKDLLDTTKKLPDYRRSHGGTCTCNYCLVHHFAEKLSSPTGVSVSKLLDGGDEAKVQELDAKVKELTGKLSVSDCTLRQARAERDKAQLDLSREADGLRKANAKLEEITKERDGLVKALAALGNKTST